ncbi:MAG: carboxylesterase family protein [Pseudomonadota bacterium]
MPISTKLLTLYLCTALLCACQAGSPPPETGITPAEAEPLVATAHGPVRGLRDDGIMTFKGIRYGADTATTRFAAPTQPQTWTEPAPATAYGASCPQTPGGNPGGLFTSWRPEPRPPISEDCLFLNVWTPAVGDGGKRAVMVWLHGGGFSTGNGSSLAYEGTRLARRGDVVVVTINHRLNLFGYLALNHYGPEFADSAVAGVLDMVLALKWVRDNIEAFGGDPNTVMIFGESGGGAKVSTLLNTPAAKGLFHRAVVQSGAMLRFPDAANARAAADQVVANLDLTRDTILDIKTISMSALSAARVGTSAGSAPTIDDKTLSRHPFEPDAAPSGADVPMLLGTTRTESSLFLGARNPASFNFDWAEAKAALKTTYPDKNIEHIVAGYRALDPEATPSDVYFEATTDARWASGHVTQAERKVVQGAAPAYLYLFNWNTPVDGGKWRSPHALEIGFVFDNVANSASMSGVGTEQQLIADMLSETWIAFAKTGNPNNALIPEWPAYNLSRRPVMVFDVAPEVVNDARGAQRRLLDDGAAYGNRYQR